MLLLEWYKSSEKCKPIGTTLSIIQQEFTNKCYLYVAYIKYPMNLSLTSSKIRGKVCMQVVYLKKWDQEAGVSAEIGKEGWKSMQECVTELALRGALE